MALGKKELMVAVVVGIAGVAAAVHFLIFQQKAQSYAQTNQEYTAAVEQLSNAEFIRDEAAFEAYKSETTRYETLATSVVAQLNLQKLDLGTTGSVGTIDQWASQTISLLSQINQRRQGGVRLTFLDQNGWKLPAQLPNLGGPGALEDKINRLRTAHRDIQVSRQFDAVYNARVNYNTALQELGLPAAEVSYFYYRPGNFYFNDEGWIIEALKTNRITGSNMQTAGGYDLRAFYNPYSVQRFGTALPALRKIWTYALVAQALQAQNGNLALLPEFANALEVGIPLDSSEPLNSINKQLQALLDIIDTAARTQVQEIQGVLMLRPINVAKATLREPGATPPPVATPAATPAMMGMGGMDMGMDMGMGMEMGMGGPMGGANTGPAVTPVPDAERVGTGAGIELWLVASNPSLVRFYYELSHKTATYGLDDVYVHDRQGTLQTSATIEIITDVNLTGAAQNAAPADGGVM